MFETVDLTRWLLATTSIILLLGGFAIVVRILSTKGVGTTSRRTTKGRQLQLVETMYLDAKHKACLIRKGSIQHLVLIGGQNPLHLESESLNQEDLAQLEEEIPNSIGFLKAFKSSEPQAQAEKSTKSKKSKSKDK